MENLQHEQNSKQDLNNLFDEVLDECRILGMSLEDIESRFIGSKDPDALMRDFMAPVIHKLISVGANFIMKRFPEGPIYNAMDELHKAVSLDDNNSPIIRCFHMGIVVAPGRVSILNLFHPESRGFSAITSGGMETTIEVLDVYQGENNKNDNGENGTRIFKAETMVGAYYDSIYRVENPMKFLMDILSAAVMTQDVIRGPIDGKNKKKCYMRIDEYLKYFIQNMVKMYPELLNDEEFVEQSMKYFEISKDESFVESPQATLEIGLLGDIKPIPQELVYKPMKSKFGSVIQIVEDSTTGSPQNLN